jgi:hypothetical protein
MNKYCEKNKLYYFCKKISDVPFDGKMFIKKN